MRTLRLIGIVIVAVLIGMSLTACSDDDDNDNKSSTNSISGSINGHDYVDLGLSVKWATCNVGAESPSFTGSLYAWGETSTKSSFTEENSVTYRKNIWSIAGDPEYDAATANWGSPWRMPTKEEMDELIDNCTWEWTSPEEYIYGYKITGPNGNSIFLRAAGSRYGLVIIDAYYGSYWSATTNEGAVGVAYYLSFSSSNFNIDRNYRYYGQSIRPVIE